MHTIDRACSGMQEVFDSLKGSDMGDELYVEGMDDAFLEWRAQHGQEWARYYGLTVSLPHFWPAEPRGYNALAELC